LRVERDDFVVLEAGSGEIREWTEIDMRFIERVVAGDQAGQHAGIGGVYVARDQRQSHPGFGLHAKALQYFDVAVTAADEHEIFQYRRRLHRVAYSGRWQTARVAIGSGTNRVRMVVAADFFDTAVVFRTGKIRGSGDP
jgi:hypothetical protein